jgi:cobalamin transport system ATP-binding protein
MPPPLLDVQNVCFGYAESDWRLQDIGFSLTPGELTAIIGPNGSGKSTLLKIAAGVLTPEEGKINVADAPLATLPRKEIARHMGYLPQQLAFGYDYSVEEIVAMGRFPHLSGMGFLGEGDQAVIDRALKQTETEVYRARRLSHLSGGERQRVFLASVLAQEPRILLLDEPTSALDIHHQAQFFRLLQALAHDGMAIAVVTHDLNLASFYCPRVVLLAEGCILEDGATKSILTQDTLSRAYGDEVSVIRDEATGKAIVLPILPQPAGGGA